MVAPAATNGNDKNINFLPLTKRQLITGVAVAAMAAIAVALIGPLTIASLATAYPAYAIGAAVGLSLLIGVAIYKSHSNKSSKSTPTAVTVHNFDKACKTPISGKHLQEVMNAHFDLMNGIPEGAAVDYENVTVFKFATKTHIYNLIESGWTETPLTPENVDSSSPRNIYYEGDILTVFAQAQNVGFSSGKNIFTKNCKEYHFNRKITSKDDLDLSSYRQALAAEQAAAQSTPVTLPHWHISPNGNIEVDRQLIILGQAPDNKYAAHTPEQWGVTFFLDEHSKLFRLDTEYMKWTKWGFDDNSRLIPLEQTAQEVRDAYSNTTSLTVKISPMVDGKLILDTEISIEAS